MAKIELIEYTGKGRADQRWHAADLLIFTKQTRLEMSADGLESVKAMSESEKRKELSYMAGTIPSSWEFVDLTFLISGVSRATAQQITRTRTASYAMQSQRVTDLRGVGVVNPYPEGSEQAMDFAVGAATCLEEYGRAIENGVAPQDARGLLPMSVECNLVAKYNLRSLVDLIAARRSLRAQGEYAQIADDMYKAVIEVWPWAAAFFEPKFTAAIGRLEELAQEQGIAVGKGLGWELAKIIDLLRKA